jgi:glycosyltransferase involved in cell wall biosynthesis
MSGVGSPELSIIVPVYNGALTLRACLEALLAAPGPSRELIVVDDASQDASVDIATALGVDVIRQSVNGGSYIARSTGVGRTSSPILVFVDSDVVIHPDALVRISTFLEKHSEYSALFGSYDANPAAATTVSQYRNLLHHFIHQDAGFDAETFWTGLGAVRRSAFQHMGGFSLSHSGMLDVELGLRLTAAGFRVAVDRKLLGTHLKSWTLGSMVRTDLFLRAKPWSDLVLERGRFTNSLNTTAIHQIGVLSSGLFVAGCVLWPASAKFAYLALISMAINLMSNLRIYRRFAVVRGLPFALRVLPLHFIYQLCAGTGFALASLDYAYRRTGIAKVIRVLTA